MGARTPFGFREWYHCYSRGVDKRATFLDDHDYLCFLQLVYLANSDRILQRSSFSGFTHRERLQVPRGERLVAVGAYCLMPNHFHLLVQEATEGGISKFMQRLGTAYAMYFNAKYERTGNLFVKPFRSKHVNHDRYFRYVAQYIHLNAAEVYEPGWKQGRVDDIRALERNLCKFAYSSLPDYCSASRAEANLLDSSARILIAEGLPPLASVLDEAALYYREILKD